MAAGDSLPLHRQFTDEQIAEYKQRAISTLKKYADTEEIPRTDESVQDILKAFHWWEFDTQREADGSVGMYGGYGYLRLEQALDQIEAGVEDWALTEAPSWARYSDINWTDDGETPREVEHNSGSNFDMPGYTLHGEAIEDAFSIYLTRKDRIVDGATAIEGSVLVGVLQGELHEEKQVELSVLLAAFEQIRRAVRS